MTFLYLLAHGIHVVLQTLQRRWCLLVFFFFSSRRRHTRFDCDWSSDVCSSDLEAGGRARAALLLSPGPAGRRRLSRSEEHTSELQSQSNLVCRLLLEKKKKNMQHIYIATIASPPTPAPTTADPRQ